MAGQPELNMRQLLQALRAELRASPRARLLHRVHCVLLVSRGCGCRSVAHWFNEAPRTIERWVERFRESGLDGLAGTPPRGRSARVDPAAVDRLASDVHVSPGDFGYPSCRWTGAVLQQHLRSRYDVTLSTRQCQRWLRRLLGSVTGH